MSSIFDDLEDETPVSAGKEIGDAVSGALSEVAKSNAQLAESLTLAIATAIRDVNKQESTPKPVQKWRFAVERDNKGLLIAVTATAG